MPQTRGSERKSLKRCSQDANATLFDEPADKRVKHHISMSPAVPAGCDE
jgi:hypothetical protein